MNLRLQPRLQQFPFIAIGLGMPALALSLVAVVLHAPLWIMVVSAPGLGLTLLNACAFSFLAIRKQSTQEATPPGSESRSSKQAAPRASEIENLGDRFYIVSVFDIQDTPPLRSQEDRSAYNGRLQDDESTLHEEGDERDSSPKLPKRWMQVRFAEDSLDIKEPQQPQFPKKVRFTWPPFDVDDPWESSVKIDADDATDDPADLADAKERADSAGSTGSVDYVDLAGFADWAVWAELADATDSADVADVANLAEVKADEGHQSDWDVSPTRQVWNVPTKQRIEFVFQRSDPGSGPASEQDNSSTSNSGQRRLSVAQELTPKMPARSASQKYKPKLETHAEVSEDPEEPVKD